MRRKIHKISGRVEEVERRYEQYGDLRALRNFFHLVSDIVYCTRARSLYTSQRTILLDKKNFDALPIPGYVSNKNHTHGAKHGASESSPTHARCLQNHNGRMSQ